jgi:hypothetical protein
MNRLSPELIDKIIKLNEEIIAREIYEPAKLAIALGDLSALAWREANAKVDIEQQMADLPPSLRIDP